MSLFKKATTVPTRLKAFVYGGPGTGKTITALSFPNPAVIDTEKGTQHYSKYKDFSVLPAKDMKTIRAAIAELLRDPQGFKTIVIDSGTVLYEAIVIALENKLKAKTGNPNYSIQPADYRIIKSEMKNFIHELLSLDMNIIMTARSKTLYAKGEFMKDIGIGPDIPEYIPFEFDVNLELRMEGTRRIARVLKDRTNSLPLEFEYTYEEFVKHMGIEDLEREPLLINQQKNLESLTERNVVIKFKGKELKTAGITAEQLDIISKAIDNFGEEKIQPLLKEQFFTDSTLDLKKDEADKFIEIINNLKQDKE